MGLTTPTRRGLLKAAALAGAAALAPGCCCRPRCTGVMRLDTDDPIIDVHVHIAADDAAGCKTAKAMRGKFMWLVRLGFYDGVTTAQLAEDFDGTVRRHVVDVVHTAAPAVDKAVVLAMDGIYDRGALDIDRTHYLVSNRYVQQLAREHHDKGVLFGASINPNRGAEKAVDELKRCTGEMPGPNDEAPPGPPPALVKWLPNSQQFDPSAGHEAFFDALAERNIPLLCHGGKEHSVPTRKRFQRMGDPRLLRGALERNVTVIVAHCAATMFLWEWGHHYVSELADMLEEGKERGWALYADVSALSMYCRSRWAVRDVIHRIVANHGDRLVLGSDYPLPPRSWCGIDNPLARNYHWLVSRGFPASIGPRAATLLNPKALAWTPEA